MPNHEHCRARFGSRHFYQMSSEDRELLILKTILHQSGGNIELAANKLGINPKRLHTKLIEHQNPVY